MTNFLQLFGQETAVQLQNDKSDFRGMHVTPAKAKRDGRTDERTEDGQSDPYIVFCITGTTKNDLFGK